jgi:hypothetical protein
LAQGGKLYDSCHKTWALTTGSIPVFDAAASPPGW